MMAIYTYLIFLVKILMETLKSIKKFVFLSQIGLNLLVGVVKEHIKTVLIAIHAILHLQENAIYVLDLPLNNV